MSSHINQLLKQALLTFGGGMQEMIPKNMEKLKALLDKTTAADVGFADHELLKPETWKRPNKAPVSYIELYEDDSMSMSIFVLGEGSKLPLHDHPSMHGLIKVVAGTLKISSYTVLNEVNNKDVEVECHTRTNVDFMDSSSVLSPKTCNLHEIESVNGVAAFLDVLAPPYAQDVQEDEHKCSYFKPVRQIGVNRMLLQKIQCPAWYYCDTFPYTGPQILDQFVLDNQESENRS